MGRKHLIIPGDVLPSQITDRNGYMKWTRFRNGTQPLPTCPTCGSAFPFVHTCHGPVSE